MLAQDTSLAAGADPEAQNGIHSRTCYSCHAYNYR